jgi:hypothetical protein
MGGARRVPALVALFVVVLLAAVGLSRLGGRAEDQPAQGGLHRVIAAIDGAPAPTGTTPAAVPTGTASRPGAAGPVRVTASISDPTPPRSARMTVTGTLLRGGAGVAGARMRTIWHFRSGDSTCDTGVTGADGRAGCSIAMAGATAGYPVKVDVSFEYEGQTYQTQTVFTPR